MYVSEHMKTLKLSYLHTIMQTKLYMSLVTYGLWVYYLTEDVESQVQLCVRD